MKKKPIDASDTPQKPAPKVEPRRLDPEPLGDPYFAERREPSEEQDPYGMGAPECDYCQYDMEDSFSNDQQDDFDDDFDADYEQLPEDEFAEYLEMSDAENLEEEKNSRLFAKRALFPFSARRASAIISRQSEIE